MFKSYNELKSLTDNPDGELERLRITPCDENRRELRGGSLELAINPESYQSAFTAVANSKDLGGNSSIIRMADGNKVDLKTVNFTESVTLDITLDSTGAVQENKNTREVKESVAWLKENLINYNGKLHATPFVKLSWGKLFLFGQVKGLTITYVLFDPKGDPLRAKVNLTVEEYLDAETQQKKQNQSSPDLSHLVTVKAGDTLPVMCYRIYQDPTYYLKVAAANGLVHFMDVKPGQRLIFPPLKK